MWHPSCAKALAWLQHISHVCWTHERVELLLKSSQVLDIEFLTVVYLQTSPIHQPLTIWRSAKLQTDAEVHGRSHEQVPESIGHAPWPPENWTLSSSGGQSQQSSLLLSNSSWVFDMLIRCFFFSLRIFSSAVTNWQIRTPSRLWKWKIRKGISSALEVLPSHNTSPLKKKTCPRNMVTSF